MKQTAEMTFLDHLEELRWRLVKCALAILAFAIPCGIFWKFILEHILLYPLRFSNPKPRLIYTDPTETVILSFHIAIAGGILFATPVIFYQIWKFVSPGLYKKERLLIIPSVIASCFCFLTGALFCYFTLPLVFRFLTSYAGNTIDPLFKVKDYMTFFIKLALAFGFVFELPVISFILTKTGVITHKFLIRQFRYAIVIIFIVAAILTPPDVLSQLLLGIPLLALYGISILIAFLVRDRKK